MPRSTPRGVVSKARPPEAHRPLVGRASNGQSALRLICQTRRGGLQSNEQADREVTVLFRLVVASNSVHCRKL